MLKTKAASRKMHGSSGKPARPRTRRTTLTLPEALVERAERLARQRRQTLSAAVAGLMEQSLRSYRLEPNGGPNVLESLQKAFAPFSDEEMLLLDGIVMEPVGDAE
jgi:hypothetical protein